MRSRACIRTRTLIFVWMKSAELIGFAISQD
jgi:hypothetical protein